MIGTTILHFEILEKLGEGGMGVVYKARDTRLDRVVAVKFLPQHLTGTEEERARFVQEAKAAATLNHPNVCTIYGIEESEGQQFIEMEFVQGTTLRTRVGATGLPSQEAVTLALQIGEALREAHARGIVHRDIKSENIMVTPRGQTKVMDFGLAKLKGSSRLTQTSSTIGTLAYMAPEQIQGEAVDARSDIFSFGVVLFEMLTGRMPFRGEHDAAIMYSILNEEPVVAASLRTDVDPELDRIIGRALEKDPEDRYQHVDDMVSELRRMQKKTGRVSRPHQVQPPEPTLPRHEVSGRTVEEATAAQGVARRKWLPYAAAAVAALASLAAMYVLVIAPETSIRSMAVLPFANQNGDPELEFLSDGFTETLINRLSRLPGVTMMSRSSVFRFKGTEIDPAEAGATLGVQAVLTGRILQRGGRISVGVELVDVRDQSHLWGEQYNREASDVIALQDEITQEISRQLRVTLSGEEEQLFVRSATRNTEAYELYLKGRFHWNKRTKEGLDAAASYLRQAIEVDPGFALAYAGLADCYSVMAAYFILSPKEAQGKARAAAEKALELDPSMAEPYVTLGALTAEYDWEWEQGERYFKRAIALNPNYATAHQWYGESMAAMGRIEESIVELRKAQELDPLSPIIATSLGLACAVAEERYEDVHRQVQKALELDPTFPRALWLRAVMRYLEGDAEGSIREMRDLVASTGGTDEARASLAYVLGAAGHRDEAAAITRQILQESERRYVSPYLIAVCYTGLGDRDEAFAWLEKGLQERSTGVVYLKTDVMLRSLHSDPRFNAMLEAMGLEPLEH